MFRIVLAVAAAFLAVLGTSDSGAPPAGKCMSINPTPLQFNNLIRIPKWQLLYVPDHDAFAEMDSEVREVISISHNQCKAVCRRKMKNNSLSSYIFTLTYGADNVIYEDTVDENGEKQLFRFIPLAITFENAILYYRCSDNGSLDIDTRLIIIPKGYNFTDAGLQELKEVDGKYKFRGGIRKLENALQ